MCVSMLTLCALYTMGQTTRVRMSHENKQIERAFRADVLEKANLHKEPSHRLSSLSQAPSTFEFDIEQHIRDMQPHR